MKFVYIQLYLIFTIFENFVYATKCKPSSHFKIDCDTCQCSEDGTKYTCTDNDCHRTLPLDRNSNRAPRHFMRRQYDGNMLNDISDNGRFLVDDGIVSNEVELDNSNKNLDDKAPDDAQYVNTDDQDFSFLDENTFNNYRLKRSVRINKVN